MFIVIQKFNSHHRSGLSNSGSKKFILSYFVSGFLTLSGKANGVQANAGHGNTEHALATNLVYIFL